MAHLRENDADGLLAVLGRLMINQHFRTEIT